MIKQLWQYLSERRKKQFFMLLILMIFTSIIEVVSIGAVVPFLGALTAPEHVFQHQLTQPLIEIFEIREPSQLLLPLTIIFIIATLVAATVRLLLLYVSTRLSYATGADLSISIYRRTLYQDYLIHTSGNSSEIINSIIIKTTIVISDILVPSLTFISSIITTLSIISIVFAINAKIALATFSIFSIIYLIISLVSKKYLQKNSQLIADKSTLMVKTLQEGLGGIRDVLIDGTQEFYCKLYQDADLSLRKASGDNVFIGSSPRYVIEAMGMILIAVLAYMLTFAEGGIMVAIPVLGALAVAAQKLLPTLQQAYNSYSSIKGATSSFSDVLNLLNQKLPADNNQDLSTLIPFKKNIIFKDISFRYTENTPWILRDVNLIVKKGEKIGFIGVTGSGKSTLLDILMGLLPPTSGELLIDGIGITQENKRAWQKHISHVPQSIYLADNSIQENIAFGIDPSQIQKSKVAQAAQLAQISETINDFKSQYKTFIGERGVQLSGGQRQRLGIARALYKDSDVLIFDEATSALDNKTEKRVMEQISNLKGNPTIFIIAHRLTTLKECDSIIRINENHSISQISSNEIGLE